MKSRRSLIGSQTDLYGSTDSSWHLLLGYMASWRLPATHNSRRDVPRARSSRKGPSGSYERTRAPRPRSPQGPRRATNRISPCTAWRVDEDRTSNCCLAQRISRERPAGRGEQNIAKIGRQSRVRRADCARSVSGMAGKSGEGSIPGTGPSMPRVLRVM